MHNDIQAGVVMSVFMSPKRNGFAQASFRRSASAPPASAAWRIAATAFLRDLTPRQRAVAIKLLEGYPRKMIAQQLNITLDTVGDHLKAIYVHFGVNSSGELAALFLRSR